MYQHSWISTSSTIFMKDSGTRTTTGLATLMEGLQRLSSPLATRAASPGGRIFLEEGVVLHLNCAPSFPPPFFFPCSSPFLSTSRRFLSFPYASPFPFDLILCCVPSYSFLFLALDTCDSPYWTVSLIDSLLVHTEQPHRTLSPLLPDLDRRSHLS